MAGLIFYPDHKKFSISSIVFFFFVTILVFTSLLLIFIKYFPLHSQLGCLMHSYYCFFIYNIAFFF